MASAAEPSQGQKQKRADNGTREKTIRGVQSMQDTTHTLTHAHTQPQAHAHVHTHTHAHPHTHTLIAPQEINPGMDNGMYTASGVQGVRGGAHGTRAKKGPTTTEEDNKQDACT